jgi:hypothetical protein
MQKRIALCLSLLATPLLAVTTSHWTHTSEADFKSGEFQHVVATNLGDVKLSRATKMLLEQDPRISAVYSLAEAPDKTTYAGTGPQGVLLSIKGDIVETAATIGDGTNLFSLLIDNEGRLLIGTGGETGRILRIDKPGAEPKEIFAGEGVQYVWAMRQTADGLLYAATGPDGLLFEIKPDGTNRVLFDSRENNLLCMIAAEPDTLYVGTDPEGLVYRINRKTGEVFVLYDAAETEVAALALDSRGNLYAGTAQAGEELPTGLDELGAADQVGRPEGGTTGVEIPSETPENPEPPALPDPNPGQPDPIPQSAIPEVRHEGSEISNLKSQSENQSLTENALQDDGGDGEDPPEPAPVDPDDNEDAIVVEEDETNETIPGGTPLAGGEAGEAALGGNAIYRIDRDGFVTEIFRMPVLVLSLLEKDGTLLVGTGSEGLVYQINASADETLVLAKVEPKQVMSMLSTSDGRVILGLANVGSVATMSSGYAADGTYTSPVLDALQVSRFGNIRLDGALPQGSSLLISTRSGNVAEPGDIGWSKWTADVPATKYFNVTSPPARFFQYRLKLTSPGGKASPVVEEVDVAYQVPNLAPQVASIQVATAPDESGVVDPSATAPPSSRMQTITWEASDPNEDTLEYALHFRAGSRGPWILLKDKLTDITYTWDTRSVADGRYQVRITTSDVKANARGQGRTSSRVSDPITIDNTAPVIGDLKTVVNGKEVRIDLKVVDRTSTVASVQYSVDSNDDWQAVSASDNIFDGPEEGVSFTIPDLPPGVHQVAIRAADAKGNQAFESVVVTIEKS